MATREEYDARSKTMWIVCEDADGDTLIDGDEIEKWSDALQKHRTPDNRELEHVNFLFHDPDAAEYNHHALSFARIGTFIGTLGDREPFDAGDPASFDTREDFGIE